VVASAMAARVAEERKAAARTSGGKLAMPKLPWRVLFKWFLMFFLAFWLLLFYCPILDGKMCAPRRLILTEVYK
jgi:hypothetical protein